MINEFAGEIIADYTMVAPILYFTAADEELYKQYKEDLLSLLQKFEKLLREKNGTPNGPVNTSEYAFA